MGLPTLVDILDTMTQTTWDSKEGLAYIHVGRGFYLLWLVCGDMISEIEALK